VLACLATLPTVAGATALGPFLDISGHGLTVSAGGTGLISPRSGDITVDIPGPVQGAILYWGGRDRPCALPCTTPPKDQDLLFDGTHVIGTVIGTEYQPTSSSGPINNIGYLADVTAIVAARGPGAQTFHVADGNSSSNLFRLDGASLLVISTDPTQQSLYYRVIVQHGMDEAWGHDPTPGETRVTSPVTFSYDSSADLRVADLWIIGGDSEATRPNRLQVSNNADRWSTLDASDRNLWDTDRWPVDIPAGSGATSVQYFSEAPPATPGLNPSSILWEVAALRLGTAAPSEEPPPGEGDEGCSPGYFKNHTASWPAAYSPGQSVASVFSAASAYPSLASQILLRAGVAALLNAESSGIDYPQTTAQILTAVNNALASGHRATILALASQLDGQNNLGCPLS